MVHQQPILHQKVLRVKIEDIFEAVDPLELRQVLELADAVARVNVGGDSDQRADLLQVVAPCGVILNVVVGVLELVQLTNRACGVPAFCREAGLLHEGQVIDMNNLLKAEVLLRELRREGFQDHLQDVLGTLILVVSVLVLVPDLCDELTEHLPLKVAELLRDLQVLDHRLVPAAFHYRMYQLSPPDIVRVNLSLGEVQPESRLLGKDEYVCLLLKLLRLVQ